MQNIIEANSICQSFIKDDGTKLDVISDFSMQLRKGEFVSIVGPSGCGKSTFLRLAAGLDFPISGEIKYNDQIIKGTNPNRSFVFQNPTLFPWLTVYENIAFGLKAQNRYNAEKKAVTEMIEIMGLKGFENAYPNQISGGMSSRTSLARTFVQRPELIILDEPLSALDAFTRMALQDLLKEIQKIQNTSMLLVTHDIEEAIYLSDRIIIVSPRPTTIINEIDVNLPHPIHRTSPEAVKLREKIMSQLKYNI